MKILKVHIFIILIQILELLCWSEFAKDLFTSEQDVEKGPDQPEAGEGEPKPEGAEGAEAEAEEKPAEEEEVLPPSKKTYQQEAAEARLKHTMKEVEQVCSV